MSKKRFFDLAEKNGIQVEYEPKSVANYATIDLYSPRWKLFRTSGCHCDCSIDELTDGGSIDWPDAIRRLEMIVSTGFEDCTDPECDNCSE